MQYATGQAGQRPDGLRRADRMHGVLRFGKRLDHRLQNLTDLLAGLLQLLFIGHTAFRQKLAGHAACAGRHGKRHRRILIGAHGHFKGATTDVHDQKSSGIPSIPTAGRKECQTRLVNARQHRDRLPHRLLDAAQDLSTVGSLTQSRRDQHEQLHDLVFLGELHGLLDRAEHGFHTGLFDRAVFLEVLHQTNRALRTRLRFRTSAGSGVDDKHVNCIRTNIKHAESGSARMQIDHNQQA